MNEINADPPTLREIFDINFPNSAALWAVLMGKYMGQALVDKEANPSQCVLRTDAALTYFSIGTNQEFLNRGIEYFRGSGAVWLVWPYQTSLSPPYLKSAETVPRLEFTGCDPSSEILDNLRRNIPAGFQIHTINAALLARCAWRDEMAYYAGSLESFLRHGIGICMMQGDEIIVEAYASALGKTRAEIGAITQENYRGRGYAPIACAYLIQACEQRGYTAYWSCEAGHTASIRVAQKLGFQEPRAYTIYEYNPG